jgi:hypothetical protein
MHPELAQRRQEQQRADDHRHRERDDPFHHPAKLAPGLGSSVGHVHSTPR